MSDVSLLPYSCYYENSRGDILHLDEAPIIVQSSGLFDYQWNMTVYDRALRDGGRAASRRRPVQEKTLVLEVFADTQEEHDAALDQMHDVMEHDVAALVPGKLWVNDQYITCFVRAAAKALDRDWTTYTVVTLTLQVVGPAWTAEEVVTMLPADTETTVTGGKRYAGRYPYRYAPAPGDFRFHNDSLTPAPMIIKIFGACNAPSVYVGGQEYAVNANLAGGEYVVIDQMEKSITKVAADGTKSNWFNQRKKSVDNFLYAPAGYLEIRCSENFPCEITFLTQRSEPQRFLRSLK